MLGARLPWDETVYAHCARLAGGLLQQACINAFGEDIGCPIHHSSKVSMRAGPMPSLLTKSLTLSDLLSRSSTLPVPNATNGHELACTMRPFASAMRSIVRPCSTATTSEITDTNIALSPSDM